MCYVVIMRKMFQYRVFPTNQQRSFLQKSKESLSGLKNKKLLIFLGILLLIVALPLATLIAQRQHAAESSPYTADAKRIEDLQTIALYLKHYYKDHGSYPSHYNGTTLYSTLAQPWISELQNYMFFLPVDPKNVYGGAQTNTFVYQYQSKQCNTTTHSCSDNDTQHFVLGAHLEVPSNPAINWNFTDFWGGWFVNYVVTDTTPIPANITIPPTPTPLPKPTCANTGVTRNADGTQNFSWLHVANGRIVDAHNCAVTLQGFNTIGLEFADALGGGITAHHIAQMRQSYNMNIWRLTLNVSWWNNNSFVPNAQMNYQDWIKQIIGWMRANGNYVEIDPVNYVTIPPGAGNIYCASEGSNPPPNPNCLTSQATSNNPPWTEQQDIAATSQFWQSIVPLYKIDPAILYDALNEPYPPSFTNYHQDISEMIDIIQQLNPNALVFVYGIGYGPIVNGTAPDYPQKNLVLTDHVYDDAAPYTWRDKLANVQQYINWYQAHNHAVSFEEWGDTNLPSKKPFADAIMSLVKNQYVAETYYAYSYSGFFDSTGQLTPLGLLLQQEYR